MDTLELITPHLPSGWTCERSGEIFVEVYPKIATPYEQGWKVRCNIACIEKFEPLILGVADICFRAGIPFKVVNGLKALRELYAKSTHFTIAGKAMTLYPGPKNRDLVSLVEKTHDFLQTLKLQPCAAPWSDRRYNSSNVSYRFGSYVPSKDLLGTDGTRVPDRRDGFVLPPGIEDPFETTPTEHHEFEPEPVRLRGLVIKECLTRTWSGSVYCGKAGTQDIILKEARCDAFIGGEVLATDLLKNEFQVLTALAEANIDANIDIAPHPMDLFQISEHYFLVMPRMPGLPLSEWKSHNNPSPESIVDTAANIAQTLLELHKTRISHMDISAGNIIVDREKIKLIDFENAQLNATDAALAEDAKQFAELMQWLAIPHTLPSGYTEALRIAEQGGAMSDIFTYLRIS